jgi:hypothetical protein
MVYYDAHGVLDTVECKYDVNYVFGIALDDRDVPSVCNISGFRISGRQFFPCEGIRQGKQMFDVTFTVTVMGVILIKHSCYL